MNNYLIKHALTNVWCNPKQDNQLIISPKRISKVSGVLGTFKLMNRRIDTPNNINRFHVYQIGQVYPSLLGLLPNSFGWLKESWITFKEAINSKNVFVNIYTDKGIEIPKYKSYYMYTKDRDLIIAIQEDTNLNIDYELENIYIKLYTNAYFQTVEGDNEENLLYCNGTLINNTSDIAIIQNSCNSYKNKDGYVFCYRNGYTVPSLNAVNISVGDTVEFIYDSTVREVVTLNIKDLYVFNSILDNRYKYLLHYSGIRNNIDYIDDIDIHILKQLSANRYEGVYYHRNDIKSHRMVTHKDYSCDVLNYTNIANTLISNSENINEFKLELKIRHSGYNRPLIFDDNRIFELYKLPDEQILEAMIKNTTGLDIWRASNLENSYYTKLMSIDYRDFNIENVVKAYGYNGISKVIGDTPNKTILNTGLQQAELSYSLMNNSTIYEYDNNGTLLEYHYHSFGSDYECTNNNTRLVEAISGKGSYKPDTKIGINNLYVNPSFNHRVYRCYIFNEVPDNSWEDITGSDEYEIVNDYLNPKGAYINQLFMVRHDGDYLAYDTDILPEDGTLSFTITETEDRNNYEGVYILHVPYGELDIFLNGKALVKDIDYYLEYPVVHIVSKRHLIQPADTSLQKVSIRFTRFCNPDLTLLDNRDYGFVEHGFLSNNNRFDIRDDKVLHITLNGNLKHRDDILFSETNSGVSIVNSTNGMPYQVKDIVIPLHNVGNEDTYTLRNKSIIIDKKVSDYLTIKLPQPNRDSPSSITERYPVFSPFISKIIKDMKTDVISDEILTNNNTDNKLLDLCKTYDGLLKFDPINEINNVNDNYVIIHPHFLNTTINLSLIKYRSLLRIINFYCKGKIDISSFITFNVQSE